MKLVSRRISRALTVILIILFIVNIFPIAYADNTISANFEMICENNGLILYADMKTGQFIVENKATGYLWRSNPEQIGTDTIANDTYKGVMQSQIVLKYVVRMDQASGTLTSFNDSVKKGGMSAQKIKNGVKFIYDFKDQGFSIPVQYSLEDGFFKAEILVSEMKDKGLIRREVQNSFSLEKENIELEMDIINIDFLPGMGAAGTGQSGYLVVPDGSGALINFNNGKQMNESYSQSVYGEDESTILTKGIQVTNEIARMPIFGIKNETDSLLAVINKNSSQAKINASVSGILSSYNIVYSTMKYRNLQFPFLSVPAVEKASYEVRYYFSDGKKIDYSSMANQYKQYLIKEKGMKKKENVTKLPLYIDLYGGIEKQKYFFGIPVKELEVLTSYDDVIKIVSKLKDKGIEDFAVRFQGWMKNGLYKELPNRLQYEGKLGNKKGFQKLVEFSNNNNILLYPDLDVINLYKGGNGISFISDGAKSYNKAPTYKYLYDENTKAGDSKTRWKLFSPNNVEQALNNFYKDYSKVGLKQISLNSIGNTIYSNFSSSGAVRGEVTNIWEKNLNIAQENFKSVMTDRANDYAFAYSDYIIDAPLESSNFGIEDVSIPFYQLAISGFVEYSTPSMNLTSQIDKMFLKAIETGSGIKFSWIGQDTTRLQGTPLEFLYSADYIQWVDTTVDYYGKVKKVQKATNNTSIFEHKIIENGLYETTYQNNAKVVVNYNKEAKQVYGKTVNAMGYIVIGGEGQ